VTPAEAAFDAVSRAAYAAFLSTPPAVTYRLEVHEANAVVGPVAIRYDELYDSRSALTRRRDDDQNVERVERPFVAAPNLDAIGSFETEVTAYRGRLVFVTYEPLPLNIVEPTPPPHADAWTFANGAYEVRFDPRDRSGTTLLATPTAAYRAAHRGWLLSRIRFDPATHLPREVELTSDPRGSFRLYYESVRGVHVLRRAELSADARVYLFGQYRGLGGIQAEADFSNYAFPTAAPNLAAAAASDDRAQTAYAAAYAAAYRAFAASPPTISYRVHVDEMDGVYGSRGYDLDERFDTRTGVARRFDESTRLAADEPPFLAAPNLDAMLGFQSVESMPGRRFTFSAVQRVPRDGDAAGVAGDAVAARFDPSDPAGTTLLLAPPGALADHPVGWRLERLRIDPHTLLPLRAELNGPNGARLVLEYAAAGGAWVVSHATYDGNEPVRTGGIPSGRTRVYVDVHYENYRFAAEPDDGTPTPKAPG